MQESLIIDDLTEFRPLLASSPIPFDESDDSDSCESDCDTSLDISDDYLYDGCLTSVSEFTKKFNAMSSKHQLSDAAKSDFLSFLTDLLPVPNKCPTLAKLKEKDLPYEKVAINGGHMYVMSLEKQLSNILGRFPDLSTLKKCDHDGSVICDIIDGQLFPEIKPNTIYLLMNTDGLSPILSRRLQIWPVIFSIVNLPINQRIKCSNLILGGTLLISLC